MTLPLYRVRNVPGHFDSRANCGLWYDKFCHVWQVNNDSWSLTSRGNNNQNLKTDWINSVTGIKIGDGSKIKDMSMRLMEMVSKLNGQVRPFKSQWHFVTGLGRNHPVENGFAWHYTLGTPYLPGSSVKGITRSWAENWQNEESEVIKRIFGPADQAGKNVGNVIFFDALPVHRVQLTADVMTPHYSEYYRNNGHNGTPPADWLSPEPIPFLVVASGETFIFAIAPRRPDEQVDRADARTAMQWLEEALVWNGAGAKTATGYGRFLPDAESEKAVEKHLQDMRHNEQVLMRKEEEEKQAVRQRQTLASMSPNRLEMEQDGYSNDPDGFMKMLTTKWLDRMDAAEVSPADAQEIAQFLAEWYKTNRGKQWEKPKGKNEIKIKRIKKVLVNSDRN
ncbi:type III-B CRISPR module RAMP protein Cmr6 [Desulfoscipio gibsoniae]